MDLKTAKTTVIFHTDLWVAYGPGNPEGHINFINDVDGSPRYLAFRDGHYGMPTKPFLFSITFIDLRTKQRVTIPRHIVEQFLGINPGFPHTKDRRVYYTVKIDKVFRDIQSGKLSAVDVVKYYYYTDRDKGIYEPYPICPNSIEY